MKKILIFGGIIIVLFVALILLTNQGKDTSNEEYYSQAVEPDTLDQKIEEEDSLTVYYFSPECHYCQETTPRLMPLAEEMGVDLTLFNLLEYESGWRNYGIESTPTVVHYEDGEEVNRIVGAAPNDDFRAFFNDVVLD
ncbi:thiol-disulfide isomerase/thioredoxin [Alkalibacillus flavidus]|uniref:Thiol-disulfide isomerase/thioredoxin n=1 Tax=Alkalibacillus flavidus TaxID=546021 RepID=A0ABV2KWB6_9BACI